MLVVEGAAWCSHLSALKLECSIYRSGRENGLAAVGAISAGAGRRLLGKIDFPETRLRPRPGALLETQTDTAQGKNGSPTEEGRQASGKGGGKKDEAET